MPAAEVVRRCIELGVTIATAESLTGGLLASRIAEVPGCSACFRGGVIAYATPLKASILGVPAALLDHVVSEAVAVEMARGACRVMGSDLGVGTTGVAGPDWLDGQPPGTVWIAVHDSRTGFGSAQIMSLEGGRSAVRTGAVDAALRLIAKALVLEWGQGNK